jgi:hypothetical protein
MSGSGTGLALTAALISISAAAFLVSNPSL